MATTQNLEIVFERILKLIKDDEEYRDMFMDAMDMMLSELVEEDGFGTEGQDDPRGDMRNGKFTMYAIERP